MPYMAVIVSAAIQDDLKAKLTVEMPALIAALKASPGVKNVYVGAVVAENNAPSTVTKVCQIIELESPAAGEALKDNKELASFAARLGTVPEPESKNLYEVSEFPSPADLKAVVSIAEMKITDLSKMAEAHTAMMALTAGSTMKTFGGKSLSKEGEGIIFIGWEGKEQLVAAAASEKAKEGQATFAKYGTVKNILATLQAA